MKDKWIDFLGTFAIGCLFMILLIILSGWIVMLLWNWIMPNLFDGVHEINIREAYGLTLLTKILFETKININKKS